MKAVASPAIITIRSMQPEDLDHVFAIEQRIFPTPWTMNNYLFELQNPISQKWVAELDDYHGDKRIAGMLVVWLLVDIAHIGTIGIDTPFRRQGIGCRLLKIALESCARLGAISSTLEVRESNTAALAMYHRFGFEQVGRRKGYYNDNGEDALLLTLDHLETGKLAEISCTNP